jgi:hypothetical protein
MRKNEFESYIYTYRDRINGDLKNYTDPKVIGQINTMLGEAESWLHADGENANKSKYVDKKKELENYCEPVKTRFVEYENIPHAFKELDSIL